MKYQKELKRFCIEQHRKMWHWITEEYRKGRTEPVGPLKEEYLAEFLPEMEIDNDCFCCEYDSRASTNECCSCPLIWHGEEDARCYGGEYRELQDDAYEYTFLQEWDGTKCAKCAELAEQIANLPERKDV